MSRQGIDTPKRLQENMAKMNTHCHISTLQEKRKRKKNDEEYEIHGALAQR
jgi:hypothetical protein